VSRERYAPPAIVERLMHEGRIGLKSGEGFYDYRGRDVAAYRKDALARVLGCCAMPGFTARRAEDQVVC
jgi:3-hydroxybutyryl-CoA dehydrogenase